MFPRTNNNTLKYNEDAALPMKQLQPYQSLVDTLLQELIAQKNYYLVSQTYMRAQKEVGAHQTPILFTAYKEFDEALIHYNSLLERKDQNAAIRDLLKGNTYEEVLEFCKVVKEEVPFLSRVKDVKYIDQCIQTFYQSRIQIWLNNEKARWDVVEFYTPVCHFVTLMGEPMIKIQHGERYAVVSLDELEKL